MQIISSKLEIKLWKEFKFFWRKYIFLVELTKIYRCHVDSVWYVPFFLKPISDFCKKYISVIYTVYLYMWQVEAVLLVLNLFIFVEIGLRLIFTCKQMFLFIRLTLSKCRFFLQIVNKQHCFRCIFWLLFRLKQLKSSKYNWQENMRGRDCYTTSVLSFYSLLVL